MGSALEVATASSCVPEVEIRHFFFAKVSRPETYLPSQHTRGAHTYLATLANRHKERDDVVYA